MKLKNILSQALCVILILTAAGCTEKGETSSVNSSVSSEAHQTAYSRDYLTLLYSAADTFNPYTLKTDVNRQLCKLLYEPLVKVSDTFEPVNALARSVDVSGKRCIVILQDAVFTDGSNVMGEDVKYSYELAKKSNTTYAKKLYLVDSVSVSDNKVTFKLKKNDPYFANVLDFPIIKKGSDKKTDSDSVVLPPVGCGRYKLNKAYDGLVQNESYFGRIGAIKEVKLINAPDEESVSHYNEIGAADMYFSEISDGNITRMSGKKEAINLNNLVYIGINQNYAPLDKQALRQAISSAINRVKLCEEAYYNNALPATGIFHPLWAETKSVQNIQIEANEEITVENLKEIGYNKLNSAGIRINSNGTPLKFTLLVNSENRIKVLAANTVASQLKSVGISVTVVEKSYKQYMSDLKNGKFQLYLGEIKFTDNMDVSSLFLKGGSAAYGLPKVKDDEKAASSNISSSTSSKQNEKSKETSKTSSQKVLAEYYNGKATAKDIAAVLQTEMAVVPICYRTGVLFYNSKISNVKNASLSDIYFSVESFTVN